MMHVFFEVFFLVAIMSGSLVRCCEVLEEATYHSKSDFERRETLTTSISSSERVGHHPHGRGGGCIFLTLSPLKEGEQVMNRHPSWWVCMGDYCRS